MVKKRVSEPIEASEEEDEYLDPVLSESEDDAPVLNLQASLAAYEKSRAKKEVKKKSKNKNHGDIFAQELDERDIEKLKVDQEAKHL